MDKIFYSFYEEGGAQNHTFRLVSKNKKQDRIVPISIQKEDALTLNGEPVITVELLRKAIEILNDFENE